MYGYLFLMLTLNLFLMLNENLSPTSYVHGVKKFCLPLKHFVWSMLKGSKMSQLSYEFHQYFTSICIVDKFQIFYYKLLSLFSKLSALHAHFVKKRSIWSIIIYVQRKCNLRQITYCKNKLTNIEGFELNWLSYTLLFAFAIYWTSWFYSNGLNF